MEDEDEGANTRGNRTPGNAYDSGGGLDESRWETSPTRAAANDAVEEEVEPPGGGGVLGLLYQFQKAQNDGRPGVI